MSAKVRDVLYNDGEGLDFNDLNNMQYFAQAHIWDLALGRFAKADFRDADTATSWLYAGTGAEGYPFSNGSNQVVTNGEGLLLQKTASGATDGSAPKLLAYYVAADELLTTLSNPDLVNPRIDKICVKIDHVNEATVNRDFKDSSTGVITTQSMSVQRDTRITVQVATGTPAGSPTPPATPSGFVVWAQVLVPAGLPAAIVDGNISDMRVPLRVRVIDVPATSFARNSTDSWTFNNAGFITSSGSGAMAAIAYPLADLGYQTSRLLRVGLISNAPSGATAAAVLQRIDQCQATPTPTLIKDLTTTLISAAGGQKYREYDFLNNGIAVWMNGWSAGPTITTPTSGDTVAERVILELGADSSHATTFCMVRFVVAG